MFFNKPKNPGSYAVRCWTKHLTKTEDARLPKQLFYVELQRGKCLRHKHKKCFKDVVKKQC